MVTSLAPGYEKCNVNLNGIASIMKTKIGKQHFHDDVAELITQRGPGRDLATGINPKLKFPRDV